VDEEADPERIARAHGSHADHCPVARPIRDAIEVTTSSELVAG
jgi:uncharacterized OsmC-like protein